MGSQDELDASIQTYYADDFDEEARITTRSVQGRIEHARVQQLLRERIAPGSRILDVGGATGVHSRWLAEDGHHVTLIDPVPAQVKAAARVGTFEARVGDARELEVEDASVDVVLLFGPLYHLGVAEDRQHALAEARRVLVPGGWLFVQGISRLAAFADRMLSGGFETLTVEDLDIARTGVWANPGKGFPGGHFHTAQELRVEVETAGFAEAEVHGVEGVSLGALEWFAEEPEMEQLGLRLAGLADTTDMRRLDHETLANMAAHILVAARA